MVVDYHHLNKVAFHAFPMPSLEHAFTNFQEAKVFSILDLNSAYYQIPLSAKSHKVTPFCTTVCTNLLSYPWELAWVPSALSSCRFLVRRFEA
jgi:hypothetical protein